MNPIDLHVHSTRSDGTYSPSDLVDYALQKGLSAFALTDHDTIDGIEEAMNAASGKPLEVVAGIEFSTEYQGSDIHILALDIPYQDVSFQNRLVDFQDSRTLRNIKMCSLLQKAGLDITYDDLLQTFPNSVITRAHYAKYMLSKGYIKSLNEAFERYIGDHCPYFVPREKITPDQAVSFILESGGIPILAHPTLYHFGQAQLEKLVKSLRESGLMGIEGIYSTYSMGEEGQMKHLAKKFNLSISGGSDFHGDNKPGLDLGTGYGRLWVPETVLTDLRSRRLSTSDTKKRKTGITYETIIY